MNCSFFSGFNMRFRPISFEVADRHELFETGLDNLPRRPPLPFFRVGKREKCDEHRQIDRWRLGDPQQVGCPIETDVSTTLRTSAQLAAIGVCLFSHFMFVRLTYIWTLDFERTVWFIHGKPPRPPRQPSALYVNKLECRRSAHTSLTLTLTLLSLRPGEPGAKQAQARLCRQMQYAGMGCKVHDRRLVIKKNGNQSPGENRGGGSRRPTTSWLRHFRYEQKKDRWLPYGNCCFSSCPSFSFSRSRTCCEWGIRSYRFIPTRRKQTVLQLQL
ncbi:hypothetical protein F4820DRAFT_318660 [Hypoxylon rubiginosum]|uniref:Uncharacterized protein n=1 Tax=Hypoxylon rubiginosum TaxID=110542 RepID=A0ACB9ZEG1_9PEZI|nr:hypothetical protein F4820DRAFT_318660 [Hypoxylon rubiginosum]